MRLRARRIDDFSQNTLQMCANDLEIVLTAFTMKAYQGSHRGNLIKHASEAVKLQQDPDIIGY